MIFMVDLGFLLLIFFVLILMFVKLKVMSLVYLVKEVDKLLGDENKVNNVIIFIVFDDCLFYYKGEFYLEGNVKGEFLI